MPEQQRKPHYGAFLEPAFLWIGRLLVLAMTFFVQQIYEDFKEVKKTINQLLILHNDNKKDVELLKSEFSLFKERTETKLDDYEKTLRDMYKEKGK